MKSNFIKNLNFSPFSFHKVIKPFFKIPKSSFFDKVEHKKPLIENKNKFQKENFYKISKKFLSNNHNDNDKDRKIEEEEKIILETLEKDFEKLLENSEDTDIEKRVKILSIKLLQATSSSEVMNLFDEKYMKSLVDVSAEEIILILYFFTNLIEKENVNSNYKSNFK